MVEHGRGSEATPDDPDTPHEPDAGTPRQGAGESDGGKAPRARRWRIVGLAVVLLLAVAGGVYWFTQRNLESTDDAFIDGNAIVIAPRVGGTVIRSWLEDNERVKVGEELLEIDPRDYQAALDDALARLAQAKSREDSARADLALIRASTAADIALAKSTLQSAKSQVDLARAEVGARRAEFDRAQADLPRYEHLAKANAASQEALDRVIAAARTSTANLEGAQRQVQVATANVAEAEARLAQAETAPQQIAVKESTLEAAKAEAEAAQAAVEQARLNLSYTKISAPADGYVTKRAVNVGDVVQKDQTLATLVSGVPWVTANFKETQLTRMRPGQPVTIEVDAYPGQVFHGRLDSIQHGTGARFSLLPPENATGNYVKVVQRVPVKIVFDRSPKSELTLSLGMSVVPTVDVGAPAGAPQARPSDASGDRGAVRR
jgi:membrane fusion protein (multidrug efflux system)